MKRSFWSRDIHVFILWIEEDESISFKSVYALLHLLSYTFFSGKPSNVSSDLAPPVQLYSYLFCTFCHHKAEIWALY